jgi:hypothetical protein
MKPKTAASLRNFLVKPVKLQFSLGILFVACSVGLAHAGNTCSNKTIAGDYAFTITGQILAPPAAAGPVAGVALTHFDGHGNMNQVDHVLHNGVTPIEDWRPGIGPYQVNPDCTGWFTITPSQPIQPITAQSSNSTS